MSPQKIKNFAISYIDEQLMKNPDWFNCITDSWIYDAENWFLDILEKQYGMKIFEEDNGEYDEYTPRGRETCSEILVFYSQRKRQKI